MAAPTSLIDGTCNILAELIAFPTVSADSNVELITYAAEQLGRCGASMTISRDESGSKANLFATIGPEGDGGIVLSGHTDVVPAEPEEWTGDPFAMRSSDGLLYGRGSCDMKGFIAAALATAPLFASKDLKRPVHYAFTYDEEVGCLGARQLVGELREAGLRPATAIIGEPTSMRIIEGHKGCFEYTTEFRGLEGHGSVPEAGVNAVEYAVRYITRLMELGEELKRNIRPNSRFDPPWTTLQVGRIEGGAARNVIAGACSVEWEMRPVHTDDADLVREKLRHYCSEVLLPQMRAVYPESAIDTHVIGEVDGLLPADDNEAREIIAELTGNNECEVVSFGTEAGLFQKYGMSVVVCGPGSIEQAHKPDEFVAVEQLEACLEMLNGLADRLER